MSDTQTTVSVGHLRPDHQDCECVEELDHQLHDCTCPGYPLSDGVVVSAVIHAARCAKPGCEGECDPGGNAGAMGDVIRELRTTVSPERRP